MKYGFVLACLCLCLWSCSGSSGPDITTPEIPTPAPFDSMALVSLAPDGVFIHWNWPDEGSDLQVVIERYTENFHDAQQIHVTTDTSITRYMDPVIEADVYYYRVRTLTGQTLLDEVVLPIFKPSYTLKFADAYYGSERIGYPIVADFDGDGDIDLLGGENINGTLFHLDYRNLGLWSIFEGNRIWRDCRAADYDSDGDWDIFCNTYSHIDNAQSEAKMFWNDGHGYFTENQAVADFHIRGYGETILAFDYDNDGDIDVFVPYYSHEDQRERSYLFRNDQGTFVDVGDLAGVSLRNQPAHLKVEGAQALDINEDGWIDFAIASKLFLNRGDGTFVDAAAIAGLPERFDEGLVFTDFNADGRLDYMTHHPDDGPVLYVQTGMASVPDENLSVPTFEQWDVFPEGMSFEGSYGFNAADLNYDGLPDIEVAAGADNGIATHFVNRMDRFEPHANIFTQVNAGLMTFSDFNQDGLMDIARRYNGWILVQENQVERPLPDEGFEPITIRVLGSTGLFNQQGRIVRLRALDYPDFVATRAVESGSGFLSQRQYDVLLATPYSGEHEVEVVLAGGARITARVQRGDFVTIWENGSVAITQGQQGPLLRVGK